MHLINIQKITIFLKFHRKHEALIIEQKNKGKRILWSYKKSDILIFENFE